MKFLRFLVAFILSLVVSGAVWADAQTAPVVLDQAYLSALHIYTHALRLANVSEDGSVVTMLEKEQDPAQKAQGHVWKLRVFRLAPGARRPELKTIWLPTSAQEQIGISPDGSSALVEADKGTRFIGVDLKQGTAHVIIEKIRGQDSFRAEPELIWFQNGSFYTVGYFQDPMDRMVSEGIVRIEPNGTGPKALHPVRNITELFRHRDLREVVWHSVDHLYMTGQASNNKLVLVAYLGAKDKDLKLLKIDQADHFGAIAAGDNRIAYPAADGSAVHLYVYDVDDKKKWEFGDGSQGFNYPYISADGKTVVASTVDLKKAHMSTFYGTEADNYTPHPVPGLTNVPMATLRFSANGKVLVAYSALGLQWYYLK